jgi:hypothetical protein
VKLIRHDLDWDGKDFTVDVTELELAAGQDRITL